MKKILPTLTLVLTVAVISSCLTSYEAEKTALSIIPEPTQITAQEGSFKINFSTKLLNRTGGNKAAVRIQQALTPAAITLTETEEADFNFILLQQDQQLEAEEYKLTVNSDNITITGGSEAGVYYGVQTLIQLFPTATLWKDNKTGRITVPAVEISDSPAYSWRGLHIDSCRHFFPKETILKFIDIMASQKINRFHWHLTEDQGWRIEIKKYPKLTQTGAYRDSTRISHMAALPKYENKRYGGFYSQEDIKEIVAYAKQNCITIIPEIDLPGHSAAVVASYPELGNYPDREIKVRDKWGISSNILNPSEKTKQVIFDILDEVMELFPGEYVHIGGDEAPLTQWIDSEVAQKAIEEAGVSGAKEMYHKFVVEIADYLQQKGKTVLGWEEIFETGMPDDIVIMPWFSEAKALPAAKNGNKVINVYRNGTYLDYKQEYSAIEPLGIGGFLPMKKVYEFNPVPSEVPENLKSNFLGSQAQLWTEYIRSSQHLEYMAMPRLCALAETLWSGESARNWERFLSKMETHYERLAAMNISYRVYKPAKKIGSISISSTKTKTFFLKENVDAPGTYQFIIDKTVGKDVTIEKVELLQDKANLSADIHDSMTGTTDIFNVYTFHLKNFKPGSIYKLLIHFKDYDNSGTLNIYQRKQLY